MRLITLAIHTYDRALAVRRLLESEGISVTLQNVNLERPEVSSGVRVRINENDLPLALRIVENPDMFGSPESSSVLGEGRHTILVPVDFSEHSLNAVNVAVSLAAARKADIGFLHTYINPSLSGAMSLSDKLTYDSGDNEEDTQNIISTANVRMKAFADDILEKMKAGRMPVARFSTQVREGVPEDAINSYAREHVPYIVVMGTRSADQKEKEMIGSVTAQVLDECRVPVLSIPATVDGNKCVLPSNVLFFSNLDQEDIIAIDALYRFFPDANLNVTIVHIPQRSRFSDRLAGRSAIALSEYCSKTFSNFRFRSVPLSPKTVAEEMKKQQIENEYDLLVVPNRRKNAFSRLFNPGLPYKLLFQSDIPMLVIPV